MRRDSEDSMRSESSLRYFSNIEPDSPTTGNNNFSQSHVQHHRNRLNFKKRKNSGRPIKSRLYPCFVVIGLTCIMVFVISMAMFFVFLEPCLNPFEISVNDIAKYVNATQAISLSVSASSMIYLRPLPGGTEPDRIDTNILIKATDESELNVTAIGPIITQNGYFLNFSRPEIFQTLKKCTTEDVTLSISPSFVHNLNADLKGRNGEIRVEALTSIQFEDLNATLEAGSINIGVIACRNQAHFHSGSGDLRISGLFTTYLYAHTEKGVISLNGPTAADIDINTKVGRIIGTSISVSASSTVGCQVNVVSDKGDIILALLHLLTVKTCPVRVSTGNGHISMAIQGFSGTFSISTLKGDIDVPDFPECADQKECKGTVNTDGPQTHTLEIYSGLGDISLAFV